VNSPHLDLRIIVLSAIARATTLPPSAGRTTTLDHLRFAARALMPLVQNEEDEQMRAHLRERDTIPAPEPEPDGTEVFSPEPSDVASHWSLTHE